ncbi:MAG: MoaD/ThiS family protein [Christensenellales bacterium]|jgi:molybdopterin converting factor small subunit
MKVTLKFRYPFYEWFGQQQRTLTVGEGCTVGEAIEELMSDPAYSDAAQEKSGFFLGELRALYAVGGGVVKKDHVLKDGDIVSVLSTYIGG